jgi:hypothetical protein
MSKRVKKWKRNIRLTSIARLSKYAFAIPMRQCNPRGLGVVRVSRVSLMPYNEVTNMLTLQQIATELAAHEFDRFCVQTYTTNSNPRCFVRVYGNHKETCAPHGRLALR